MVFIKSLLAICVLSAATVATGANLMGEFQGASLQFDAEIESPEINTQVGTVPLIGPGQSVEVQLFIPGAAGDKTLGYTLEFDEATLSLFTITGEDFLGAQLSGEPDKPVLAALLIGQPTIPTNGFVGTLTFIAKSQIEEGLIIRPSFASLAGPSAEGDELDLSGAAIMFTADHYVAGLVGDLDRDGDVDFRDFLAFAVNYGKSGPVGTERTRLVVLQETVKDTIILSGSDGGIVTVVDTVMQTVRDTIVQTVHDTVEVVTTVSDTLFETVIDTLVVQSTIHDTVFLVGEQSRFDGFYVLTDMDISSDSGVDISLSFPAITGSMAIDEPLISLSFVSPNASSSLLGTFVPEQSLDDPTVFFFDTLWSTDFRETIVYVREGNLVAVAVTSGEFVIVLLLFEFDKSTLGKPVVAEIEALMNKAKLNYFNRTALKRQGVIE
jgi:hypothetical protein